MEEYEEMSQRAANLQKSRAMTKPDEETSNEPIKKFNQTFAGIMGFIFILLGVVGAVLVVLSFDWQGYDFIKKFTATSSLEIEAMKAELMSTWLIAGATLIVNLAIGSVLLALDKIIRILSVR